MWVIIHGVLWAGRLSRAEDLPFPFDILSSMVNPISRTTVDGIHAKTGLTYDTDFKDYEDYVNSLHGAQDKTVNLESINELDINAIINFFSDPNPSFRNLIMNTGFVSNEQPIHLIDCTFNNTVIP